jgi:cysteine sulfinate desulfinase/cysteine desulfurase-like protein
MAGYTPQLPVTLRDHAQAAYRLHAYCSACEHDAILSPLRLSQSVGWEIRIDDLRKKLRCSKCGSREAMMSVVQSSLPDWKEDPSVRP